MCRTGNEEDKLPHTTWSTEATLLHKFNKNVSIQKKLQVGQRKKKYCCSNGHRIKKKLEFILGWASAQSPSCDLKKKLSLPHFG